MATKPRSKNYSITVTAKSLKKMEKVLKSLEGIDGIEIYHHIAISGKNDFQIMKDVGGNYEKIKKSLK